MRFSFHFKAKENFVHKHYGDDIEVIMVRDQEIKTEAVKIISKVNKCNMDEILFVDDKLSNIINFKNIGINALLTNDVDSLIRDNK